MHFAQANTMVSLYIGQFSYTKAVIACGKGAGERGAARILVAGEIAPTAS